MYLLIETSEQKKAILAERNNLHAEHDKNPNLSYNNSLHVWRQNGLKGRLPF